MVGQVPPVPLWAGWGGGHSHIEGMLCKSLKTHFFPFQLTPHKGPLRLIYALHPDTPSFEFLIKNLKSSPKDPIFGIFNRNVQFVFKIFYKFPSKFMKKYNFLKFCHLKTPFLCKIPLLFS